MNRAETLDTAKEYVTKDRAADHGNMEDNFAIIARMWSAYLGARGMGDVRVSSVDVGNMMVLLKMARAASNPDHEDNYVDAAGYAACAAECATGEVK